MTPTPKKSTEASLIFRRAENSMKMERMKQTRMSHYFPPIPGGDVVRRFQESLVKFFVANKLDVSPLSDASFRKVMDVVVPGYSSTKDTTWKKDELFSIRARVLSDTRSAGLLRLLSELKSADCKVVCLILNTWPKNGDACETNKLLTISATYVKNNQDDETCREPLPISARVLREQDNNEDIVRDILRGICSPMHANGIDIGSVVCGNHMASLRSEVCESLNKSRSEDSHSNANTIRNSEVRCINTTCLMDLNDSVMSELMLNVFDNWVEVYRNMFSFGERLERIHPQLKERLSEIITFHHNQGDPAPSTFVDWLERVVKEWEEIKSLLSDAGALRVWNGLDREARSLHSSLSDVFYSADNHARAMSACEPLKMMRDLGNFMKDRSLFATLYELDEVYRKVTKLETIDEATRVVVLSKLIEALGGKKFLLRYHPKRRPICGSNSKAVEMFEETLTEVREFNAEFPNMALEVGGAKDTLVHYFKNGGCHSRSVSTKQFTSNMTSLEYWDLHSTRDDVSRFIYLAHLGASNARQPSLQPLEETPNMETFTSIMMSELGGDTFSFCSQISNPDSQTVVLDE
ncbi:hypothetical protein FOZ60_005190 [Perkinsus olseni]|uniref:Uncharacterized protein n=1 Tax=Perkinsus olseni TaxID=32597 RepID=A0A7J6NRG6_PEROL|nr:hypothetical protein FOZ60_005190 [Perkinsus olseni]